jgi:hypothetical protein
MTLSIKYFEQKRHSTYTHSGLSAIMLSVVILGVITLNIIMLSIIFRGVIMLSVVAPMSWQAALFGGKFLGWKCF